jgi:UDP-N-acetylglucosamine 3-dehydrogenase
MIRIGILGAGFMGKTHAQALMKMPGVEVAAIVSRDQGKAKQLAAETGGDIGDNFAWMYNHPAIDIIDVCLPTPLHPETAIGSFQAGKHVIMEKPLALSLPEADSMLEAACASGKFLMVAHVLRFWPEYMAIQKLVQSGRIGKPRLATAYRLANMPQWADWFRDPVAFGGAVLDLHIHDLDFMNLLFGKPLQATAIGMMHETGGWNHVISQITYGSGGASVEASSMLPQDYPFTAGLKLVCETGVIEYHFRAGGASFEQGRPLSYLLLHEDGKPSQPIPVEAGDGYYNELAYFIDCVKTGTPPSIVTPEDSRLAVQTALACRQSLEESRAVRIG